MEAHSRAAVVRERIVVDLSNDIARAQRILAKPVIVELEYLRDLLPKLLKPSFAAWKNRQVYLHSA